MHLEMSGTLGGIQDSGVCVLLPRRASEVDKE
jgi:hypothetical protein